MSPKNSSAEEDTEVVWTTTCPEPFSAEEFKISEGEKRLNYLHCVRHFIAVVIIGAYVYMVLTSFTNISNSKVPESFIALVSAVIGFYFGKQD